MSTIARFNLMLERLMKRILEPPYLFKDSLKKPRVFAPNRALWIGLVCSLVLVSGILATTPRAFAAIPHYLNFQGKLTDSDGNPVADGSYSITFRLYSDETGGTALWEEAQSVTVSDGVFTVVLGTTTSFSSENLEFNTQYWLSVQVSGDTEMSPRQRLTAAGYAINADSLDTLTSRSFLRRNADDTVEGQITFNYTGTPIIIQPSSASTANTKLIDVKDTDGTSQFSVDYEGDIATAGRFTVGEDGTGYDIKFYGATSGKYMLWDESADKLISTGDIEFTGTTTYSGATQYSADIDMQNNEILNIGVAGTDFTDDGGLNLAGALDVDGTANLDEVDIDGAVQIDAAVTIGTSDTGQDIKFYGSTTGKYLLWDESADALYGGQSDGSHGVDLKFFGATADKYLFWDQANDKLIVDGEVQFTGATDIGSANLTTTGDVTIDSDSSGLIVGTEGTLLLSAGLYTAGADNFSFATSKTALGAIFESTATKLRFVADSAIPGYGYFQAGVQGGSDAGTLLFSGYNAATATAVNFKAITAQFNAANITTTGEMDIGATPTYDNSTQLRVSKGAGMVADFHAIGRGDDTYLHLGHTDVSGVGYGHKVFYVGSGSGDANYLEIRSDNSAAVTGTGITHMRYHQASLASVNYDDMTMSGDQKVLFRDSAIHIQSAADGHLDLTADTSVDVNAPLTVGVNTSGYDVKFYGSTSGKFLFWDETAGLCVGQSGGTHGVDVWFYGATDGKHLLWDESDDELDLSTANLVLPVKTTTGDPASPVEGQIYVNTEDNKVRVYADSAWRDLATW